MCQCERACIIKVNYTETSHSVSQELMERVYIYLVDQVPKRMCLSL